MTEPYFFLFLFNTFAFTRFTNSYYVTNLSALCIKVVSGENSFNVWQFFCYIGDLTKKQLCFYLRIMKYHGSSLFFYNTSNILSTGNRVLKPHKTFLEKLIQNLKTKVILSAVTCNVFSEKTNEAKANISTSPRKWNSLSKRNWC